MAWIKRNLFFFIGGLVALALLGAAGFYNYTSWSRNSEKLDKLNEIYGNLKSLNDPASSPGNEKINKIEEAKDQEAQLRGWLDKSRAYFQPIDPVPPSTKDNPVTSESFSAALRRTIDTLQHEAESAHVDVPSEYGFSFEAERSLVKFSPGSLDLLASQLGEVKTISEILYQAGVNDFDGIQRIHVSDDDASGPQSDYISDLPITHDGVTMTPYVITFRSFGPEIARVFVGFANSPHGFIIQSLNVQPAGSGNSEPSRPPMNMGRPGFPPPPGGTLPEKGGLVTVLKEQLLRISMKIEIVKLQPKN